MLLQYTCIRCGAPFVRRPRRGRAHLYCSLSCYITAHYEQPLAERFWSKVQKTDSCWIWSGRPSSVGYGVLTRRSADGSRLRIYAHRYSYELHKGPIPAGLVIDHLCRNRCCVNPDHLEAVTMGTNVARGEAPAAVVVRNGFCIRGHPRTPENLYRRPDGHGMVCRLCATQRGLELSPRNKYLNQEQANMIVIRYANGNITRSALAEEYGVPLAIIKKCLYHWREKAAFLRAAAKEEGHNAR